MKYERVVNRGLGSEVGEGVVEERTVLSVILAIDGRGRGLLGLETEGRVAHLSGQAELKVEDAGLAAVFALCAARADHRRLVPRASPRQPPEHSERPAHKPSSVSPSLVQSTYGACQRPTSCRPCTLTRAAAWSCGHTCGGIGKAGGQRDH